MTSYWSKGKFYHTEGVLVRDPEGRELQLNAEQMNVDAIKRHEQFIATRTHSVQQQWREVSNLSRHDRVQIMRRMGSLNKANF